MITAYSIDKKVEWDSKVKSFERYDVYYLNGYAKAFEIHGDGIPILLSYDSDVLHGINVVMKRDIALDKHFDGLIEKNRYFDLATPYGYGGWYFEGEESEKEITSFSKEYLEWCSANSIISEFVRFHPILNNSVGINQKFYDITLLGNTVAIHLDSIESIWENFSSKNRGHIRKAINSGVTVDYSNDEPAFSAFRSIYESTMQRDEAAEYYYFDREFYESIRNDLDKNELLFTASLNGTPIAAAIMLFADKCMNYHLSGQLFDYRKYSGTSLLLFEAAKWGCENGYRTLHLGGGVGAQPGSLYDYKKSFNTKGKDTQYYIGRKVFNQDYYQYLCQLRSIESSGCAYFPAYRQKN